MSSPGSDSWNPTRYASNARFVSELGMPVVELLAPQPGERLLDLGCGDGALTIRLVELGCTVIGVDSSAAMVDAARAIGIDAQVVDGHSLPYVEAFDAVFSNAALHWMKDPEPVLAGVWRSLEPGGRFVAEMGGYGNVATIVAALDAALAARGLGAESPWFFPHAEEYRGLLRAAGFEVSTIALFPRPTPLPGDVGEWLRTFAQHYMSVLPENERPAFIAEVVESLRGALCDESGSWTADYVRLRFRAEKPSSSTPKPTADH